MKHICWKIFLFSLFFLIVNDILLAQKGFKMINLTSEKVREFNFGKKVMFKLKESASDSLITKGIINKDMRVYELKLTGMDGQNLIFNKKIVVPYSDMDWLSIHTSGRVVRQLFGIGFLGILMPLYASSDPRYGLAASVIVVPISILFFRRSGKYFFTQSQWKIQPSDF